MLGVEDESILVDFEEAEKSNPSPQQVVGERVIYSSRKLGIPKIMAALSYLTLARPALSTHWEDVQPLIYRAPEVLLRMPWDQKIDIWNLGVLTWDLFEQGHLFYARDANKNDSDSHHLAEMIALLGLPPKEILQKSEYASEFFDDDSRVPESILIYLATFVLLMSEKKATEEREICKAHSKSFSFCFMRKMLQWRPEDRASADELLSDPWLRSP
ncbi:serine/threonine protein kinase [Penicillium alfredii]|uniref:Serine/threonine protein kinase n=1 Tax=Penicillium alfredii TaxID=1506179 RepID=A0A9W9JYS6_9EURO|nr:serine/threonine protein kinase [Penicillium alfredii]KAJ5086608.1 serine/threonine protein kinase [Penicillium alfredii]